MSQVSRREMLQFGVGMAISNSILRSKGAQADLFFRNVESWGVEGKGWSHTERYFDRLPAPAKGKIPDSVWNLGKHSAGLAVRFQTDSSVIAVKMDLLSSNLAMPHMPATGVSGFDLYVHNGKGKWQWIKQTMPGAQHVESNLASGLSHEMREYCGFLPLYNGVTRLEIGVESSAKFVPMPPRKEKPIVFYGTSICQGACASRPGIAYTAILNRMLEEPIINLGFSGAGKMDESVVDLLCELDPSLYVIDCLPNMSIEQVAERTPMLIKKIRMARPKTPILLVEDRTFAQAPAFPEMMRAHEQRRMALRKAFEDGMNMGITGLRYLRGDRLIGVDSEGTTDGSHPNDLGMLRYAEALRPAIIAARK